MLICLPGILYIDYNGQRKQIMKLKKSHIEEKKNDLERIILCAYNKNQQVIKLK